MKNKVKVRQRTIDKIKENIANYSDLDLTIDFSNAFTSNGNKTLLRVVCNHCETSVTRDAGNLTTTKFRCDGCLLKKYKKLVENSDVCYVSHSSKGVIVSCKGCLTEFLTQAKGLVRYKSRRCVTCQNNAYEKAASDINFTFLGLEPLLRKENAYAGVSCNKCSYVFSVSARQIIKQQIVCRCCIENRYVEILSKKNCKFIRVIRSPSKSSRVEYSNKDGDILTADICAITQNSFAVTTDTHWTAPHCTYLIFNKFQGNVYCKIGTANSPEQRLVHLNLLGESKVVSLKLFTNRFEAKQLEFSLHKEFKPFKLDSEIAKIFTGRKLRRKRAGQIERVTIKDGVHEWFTHEVYDILKDRYRLEK